ncbi:MAG: hypothetical protein QG670_533 [Thermoproteota archaeon]|nr:hypothetical protein [Thermoproteota archaeon]
MIKAETTPTYITDTDTPLTIIDFLKNKIIEIDGQIVKLETEHKQDKMTSDAYFASKLKLSQARESFKKN